MSDSSKSTSRSIYLNTSDAQAEMRKLEATAVKLKTAIDSGELSAKKLKVALTKLDEVNASIKNVKTQIDGLRPSFIQTQAEVNKLRNELKRMSEDAPGYAEKFKAFQAARLELDRMATSMRGVAIAEKEMVAESSLLGRATSSAGLLVGGLFGAFYLGTHIIRESIESNAKLSDSLAQLKIYMHGSSEDANVLYESLKKLDTRTSIPELLNIATIVAKKGVAKEEITGVTKALDQLFVVLGKEVGDPHEAVSSLVKLVNVYSEDHHVTADNISNIGAAIQKLTSSGVATGGFLISFAERLAGVRGITGITIQSVLGLGAALEELGQRNESAATAAQKLITQMFLKPELYAKAAGLSIKEFSDILAKDPVEALIKVAAVLKSTAAAPADLITEFSSMNVTGARVFGVLGDIAGNADYMRKRLNDASKAFGDQSSVVAAFNEKNTTLAATLDKLGKVIANSFVGTAFVNFFKNALKGINDMLTPAQNLTDTLNDQSKKVRDLEKNIVPLIDRLDVLRVQQHRSVEENIEMNRTIQAIAAAIPSAIIQYDKLGNAIGISTIKAREFIDLQQYILKQKNGDQISSQQKQLDDINKQLESKKKEVDFAANNSSSTYSDTYIKTYAKTEAEFVKGQERRAEHIKGLSKDIDDLSKKAALVQGYIDQLSGKTLEKDLKASEDAAKNLVTTLNNTGADSVKSLKEIIAEIKELKRELLSVTDANQAKVINDKIKELSAQRDALEGKDPKKSKEVKAEESIVKQLEAFKFELQQVGKQTDDQEIDRITRKYNELTTKAVRYGFDILEIEKAKNKAVAILMAQEEQKRKDELDKINQAAGEETYRNFQDSVVTQSELQKQAETKRYADGVISKRQLQDAIRKIDIETYDYQIALAENFSGVSKKASQDLLNFKKKKGTEEVADAVSTREHIEALQKNDALAAAQVAVIRATQSGKGRLEAQLSLLKVEHDNELKNTELTESQKEKIELEYQQRKSETTLAYYAQGVEEVLNYVKRGLDILSTLDNARAAKETAALNKELKGNDAKKASLKKELDSKFLSQQQYNQQVAALDAQAETKKTALEKKQQERAKKIAIEQALINGAMAITSTLAAKPGALDILSLGAFRAIQIGFTIAETFAQIAAISDTKAYAGGGKVQPIDNGKIDVAPNIPTQPNGDDVLATVKVGEVLLNKQQQAALGGDDTFRRIGVPGFAAGGSVTVKPFWQSRPYRTIDYGRVAQSIQVVKYAEGGRVANGAVNKADTTTAPQTDPALLEALAQQHLINMSMIETLSNLKARLDQPFNTIFSTRAFKQIQDDEKKRNADLQMK